MLSLFRDKVINIQSPSQVASSSAQILTWPGTEKICASLGVTRSGSRSVDHSLGFPPGLQDGFPDLCPMASD